LNKKKRKARKHMFLNGMVGGKKEKMGGKKKGLAPSKNFGELFL